MQLFLAGPLALGHWQRIRTRLHAQYEQTLAHLNNFLTREQLTVDSGPHHLQQGEHLRGEARGALQRLDLMLTLDMQLQLELLDAERRSGLTTLGLQLMMLRKLESLLAAHVENLPSRQIAEHRLNEALVQYAGLRSGSSESIMQERQLLRQVLHDIPVLGAEDVGGFVEYLRTTRALVDDMAAKVDHVSASSLLQLSLPTELAEILRVLGVPISVPESANDVADPLVAEAPPPVPEDALPDSPTEGTSESTDAPPADAAADSAAPSPASNQPQAAPDVMTT